MASAHWKYRGDERVGVVLEMDPQESDIVQSALVSFDEKVFRLEREDLIRAIDSLYNDGDGSPQ